LALDPANEGLAIFADEQTAGRGQYGRSWQAPPGSSVLLSVLIFPPPELRRPVVLTAWAAVSVCELVQEVAGVPAKIKWPNDILLQGKKVCGILIEQRMVGQQCAAVAGIGLNVAQSRVFFDEAQLPLAGSLAERTGQSFDRDAVAQGLLTVLDREYVDLLAGDTATLEARWKWRLGLLGKPVTAEVQGHAALLCGRLIEASFAALQILADTGERMVLSPEKIKQLSPR
jgi:BirA family biotin operon repressor/biotin-[acetyl-CoA-carboxylase] ligase